MPTTPRTIQARYPGTCWQCRKPFAKDDLISYLPPEGERKGRSSHLACVVVNGQPTPDMPEANNRGARRGYYAQPTPAPQARPALPAPQPTTGVVARMGQGGQRLAQAATAREPQPADPTPERARVGDGFPVSRQPRASHVSNRQPVRPAPKPVEQPYVRPQSYTNNPDCAVCQRGGPGPSHNGSSSCRSGSPASGGRHAHCSCDTCY